MAGTSLSGVAAADGQDTVTCQCGTCTPDTTGLATLLTSLQVSRLLAYKVTVPGAFDIVGVLNDLIAGVEELQR